MSDKRRYGPGAEELTLNHKEKAIAGQPKNTINSNSADTKSDTSAYPEEAKEGADTYLDPKTGLTVFTAKYLLNRGYC